MIRPSINSSKLMKKVLWLYGLSGAGKTTLSRNAADHFKSLGYSVILLDGDSVRQGVCNDLGYDKADRDENVRRVAHLAKLLCNQNFLIIVALITPLESMRAIARHIIGDELLEFYIQCDYHSCAKRDVKGLYERAERGDVLNVPGKDFLFEIPNNGVHKIDTRTLSVDEATQIIVNAFLTHGVSCD